MINLETFFLITDLSVLIMYNNENVDFFSVWPSDLRNYSQHIL